MITHGEAEYRVGDGDGDGDKDMALARIAFGSCAHQRQPQVGIHKRNISQKIETKVEDIKKSET